MTEDEVDAVPTVSVGLGAGTAGRMSTHEEQNARMWTVIEAYFRTFNARDRARMPMRDNVVFQAPVTPEPVTGREALRPYLS